MYKSKSTINICSLILTLHSITLIGHANKSFCLFNTIKKKKTSSLGMQYTETGKIGQEKTKLHLNEFTVSLMKFNNSITR